jgi:hypothetical protein
MPLPSSRPEEDDVKALGAFIDVTYSLIQHMRFLQSTQGGFTYDDLAALLMGKFEFSLPDAQQRVWQVVTHMNQLIEYDGTVYQMIEQAPPTIDETVAGWQAMASGLKLKPQPAKPISLGSRASQVEAIRFERFRPKRSAARWLKEAPECVIACYDNGGRTADRYTVVFGGSLWDTGYARANWQAGLDPRLTQSLSMSENPTHPQGVSMWSQCLRAPPGPARKVNWLDLPEHIRAHVLLRANAANK